MLLLERDTPEALIPEARRRTRRRRRRGGLIGAVAVLAGLGAYLAAGGGGSGVLTETASRPFANVDAFRGKGELAFISRGRLWVLDGQRSTLRRVAAPRRAALSHPTFSRDGRWVAFEDGDQLWVARGDGTDAHELGRLRVGGIVGWGPGADVLAVYVAGRFAVIGVALADPSGRTRVLMSLPPRDRRWGYVESAVWSPDGTAVAVSAKTIRPADGAASVSAYPVDGRPATTWFYRGNRSGLPGLCNDCHGDDVIPQLAGWWPHVGIGFWVYCCGMTHNNDDTPLEIVARAKAMPRIVARTLSDGVTDAVSGDGGRLAVVSAHGGGRELTVGKTVEVCRSGVCAPVPAATVWSRPGSRPGSAVTLDPAWSPDRRLLAYVKAPVVEFETHLTVAWYATHDVYIYDTVSGRSHQLAQVRGASVPEWSKDGRDLLYVSGDGLWLAPVTGAAAQRIAYPLYGARRSSGELALTPPFGYYGQIPWSAQFSWWSP